MDVPPLVSATDPQAQDALRTLDRRMREYYNRPAIDAYFETAHSFNATWSPPIDHWVIREKAAALGGGGGGAAAVLDLGCGSGHSWLNLKDTGVRYTGLDVSESQILKNRTAYGGNPTFVAASLYQSGLPDQAFDLTFSTYVLEHLVWPHLFLREMFRLTRPGGWMIIICPHFRPFGRIPSFPYGKTVLTLKQRLRGGHLLAAAKHLYRRNLAYPKMLAARFPRGTAPFLINLEPTCLSGTYYADNDAVYLTDRDELVSGLTALGATDETAHVRAEFVRPQPAASTCFIIARRDHT